MKKFFSDKNLYFWLSCVEGLGLTRANELVRQFGGIGSFYDAFITQKGLLLKTLGELYYKMETALDEVFLTKELNIIKNENLSFITPSDELYPQKFKNLNDAPLVLYAKGDINLLATRCITIVGTRHPSAYGKKMSKLFASSLCRHGLTVVSGLATGIDTYAHRFTLDEGGKTIAVLGNGHNEIYPAVNNDLYREIAQNGLVISEYKPFFKGTVYSYPRRNRLLSALSEGVLIIEAGEKSGTMYTVEFALEQGVNVYALAGAADNIHARGNLRLIRNAQCAMVFEPEHILEDLKITPLQNEPAVNSIQLDFLEQKILDLLSDSALNYENILYNTKLTAGELNRLLTLMEIKGLICKNGQIYSLA